jgi:thioredoxin-dependent peroxiredoxin
MLADGSRAPQFELCDQHGQRHTLRSLLDRRALILYFYPADFTPGCTREACAFRDLQSDLERAKLRIVGVSPQDRDSHRRFADKYGLRFTLLSDLDKAVTKAYRLDGPLGFGVRRGTYLIGAEGVIQASVLADLRISAHQRFVRLAVEHGATTGTTSTT